MFRDKRRRSNSVRNKPLWYFRQLDGFGENFRDLLEDGNTSTKSIMGACLTILVLIVVLGISILKVATMINMDDTNMMYTTLEYHYTEDESISEQLGFKVAFGLIDWFNPEFFEDPDYATL